MEADPEHVYTKPGEAGDDVAEHGQVHQSAFSHQAAPAGVQDGCVPEDDEERAVFFRVPTPEAAPGLVGPNSSEDGSREAEQGGEADNAVNHFGQGLANLKLAGRF